MFNFLLNTWLYCVWIKLFNTGPLQDSAVWIDESQTYHSMFSRNRGPTTSIVTADVMDDPLGISDEGTEWVPDYTAGFWLGSKSETRLHALGFLTFTIDNLRCILIYCSIGSGTSHYISPVIGASRPLTGSPIDLPTFFFFSPSAAENGIPGGQTHGRKPWIDLIF